MGITGLLPLLKSIMVPIHIKDLEGCTVAVDTYSWLHKGALSCSTQLCKSLPTTKHIEYCMHRVNLLRHYGVKPLLVFDGGLLPMKLEQENKRARARKENLARAVEHESNGNSSAAYECYQKAVDISPSIAHELIQVLKHEGILYVVAPYEADAQMTFLAVTKQVDAVITEDSDLVPFGCPRIVFKMDKYGQGVEFQSSMLQQNKDLNFAGFTKQMLLEMCILSGCDYLQSLPGMGLKRAHALIKKFRSFDKVLKHLRYNTVSVPPLYEETFRKAILTFQHQRVYDPMTEDIVHLTDISDVLDGDLDFLGPLIPQNIAKGIAKGDIDPFTQLPFKEEGIHPKYLERKLQPDHPKSERKKLDLPVQKNVLTKYFCFASLEAKRNFRAPRISPKQSSPLHDSSSGFEVATTHMHSISGSLVKAKQVDTALSPNSSDEDGFVTKDDGIPAARHCEVNAKVEDDEDSREHTPMQQPNHSLHKPCLTLHMQRDSENDLDAVNSKIKTQQKKIIVRSRFFQSKPVNEDDKENAKDKSICLEGVATDLCKESSSKISMFRNYDFSSAGTKRKTPPNNSDLNENATPKFMRTNETETVVPKKIMRQSDDNLADPGDHIAQFDCTEPETNEEGKFGSNISHLGRYSTIAEKTMENFVSVISAFRCTASGTRASGLRAPLKDVQNKSTNRSTPTLDLSQFAYVPKKQKTTAALRKGPK